MIITIHIDTDASVRIRNNTKSEIEALLSGLLWWASNHPGQPDAVWEPSNLYDTADDWVGWIRITE